MSRAPRKLRATAASPQPAATPAPERANPERGEHEVRLGGITYVLRPTYNAIRAIESKTDCTSICQLAANAQTGALSYSDCAIAIAELIRAGAKPEDVMTANVNDERIGELIYEAGLPGVAAVLTICLVDAATGGRTSSGEKKAVATA